MSKVWEFPGEYGVFETWNTPSREDIFELKQIHSPFLVRPSSEPIEADGYWDTQISIRPLLIKTADCLPILIEGKKGFAFIHAGWRGLHLGILKQDKLLELIPQRAIIGPHISQEHYEVSDDFTKNFPLSDNYQRHEGKLKWSLLGECRSQLQELSTSLEITHADLCTFKNSQLHSYRRDQTNQRNWNIFRPYEHMKGLQL